MRRLTLGVLLPFTTILLSSPAAEAQVAFRPELRYELAQRLRDFELAWDAQPEPEARARAVVHLEAAVKSFFSFRLSGAAQCLDEARMSLDAPESSWSLAERRARALRIEPSTRLLDARSRALTVTMRPHYEVEGPRDGELSLTLRLEDASGAELARWSGASTSKVTLTLPAEPVPEGDGALLVSWTRDGRSLCERRVGVSFVRDLEGRLAALKAGAGRLGRDTRGRTAREISGMLASLAQGETLETDIPAARRLASAEAWLAEDRRLPAGEHWLSPAKGGAGAALRLMIPEAEGPRPVCLALHGAGGSENMFFETYGHGRIVELCEARGWVLAAPRLGLMGARIDISALLDELEARCDIDRSKVVIIGHSMGAGVATGAVSAQPKAVQAAAFISGGGRVSGALEGLPCYCAAGTRDFGQGGTQALARALESAGAEVRLELREGLEHLIIVQETLDAAFAVFDAAVGVTAPKPRLY